VFAVSLEFDQNNPEFILAREVCETLQKSGHQAWLAGGCVRDALIGAVPADFDVATSASPDEIEKLFPKTVAVGKVFGVIIVVEGSLQIEVATFRQDGEYKDGRRPDKIVLSTPEEDAKRRDFTINALFYDFKTKQVIDFVNGQKDLAAGIIRAVGEPHKRFAEDHLRLLRAVRFVSQLGMKLETETDKAMTADVALIKDVSGERLFDELNKLLKGKKNIEALRLLFEKKFLDVLFPKVKFSFRDPAVYFKNWSDNKDVPVEMKLWFSFLLWLEVMKGSPWSEVEIEKLGEQLRFSRELKQNIKAGFLWLHKKDLFSDKTNGVGLGELLEYSFEPGPSLGIKAHEVFHLTDEAKQTLSQVLKKYHELFAIHRSETPSGMPKSLVVAKDFSKDSRYLAGRIVTGPELGIALKKCYQWQLENPRWNAEQILNYWKQHG